MSCKVLGAGTAGVVAAAGVAGAGAGAAAGPLVVLTGTKETLGSSVALLGAAAIDLGGSLRVLDGRAPAG
jgi:hypothetical protein